MSPMRPGFDHLAAVTVTESAVTVTVREIAAAWGPCGHKIRPLRSCGTPTAWPQLKNFCRMMRPYHAAAWYGRMAAARPYGRTLGYLISPLYIVEPNLLQGNDPLCGVFCFSSLCSGFVIVAAHQPGAISKRDLEMSTHIGS